MATHVAAALEAPDDVAQRRGDEEVLLLQAQLLARVRVVGGVQHVRDRLGALALLHLHSQR